MDAVGEHDDLPAAKRQQIILGAERVFTECGYEGASMQRIAGEAGVSKGTLYNYFDSKSTLFGVFIEQKAASSLARIFETVAEDDDPATALHAIALRMLEMLIAPDNLLLYRIVVSEARKFPHLATTFWQSGPCRAIDYMTGWMSRQVASGRLATADPRFAAEQFIALCQTRVTMQRRLQITQETSAAEIEQVIAGAVRLFLAGYAADPLAPGGARSYGAGGLL